MAHAAVRVHARRARAARAGARSSSTGPSGGDWTFAPDDDPVTTIRGDGVELCLVAARRVDPAETGLEGEGPDAAAVLELVRTYA